MSERVCGTVEWFNTSKGYGFIRPDNGSVNAFVHFRDVAGEGITYLTQGDRVEYEYGENKKGPCAVKVMIVAV